MYSGLELLYFNAMILDNIADDLINSKDPNDPYIQEIIFKKHGKLLNDLTDFEIKYIIDKVERNR